MKELKDAKLIDWEMYDELLRRFKEQNDPAGKKRTEIFSTMLGRRVDAQIGGLLKVGAPADKAAEETAKNTRKMQEDIAEIARRGGLVFTKP